MFLYKTSFSSCIIFWWYCQNRLFWVFVRNSISRKWPATIATAWASRHLFFLAPRMLFDSFGFLWDLIRSIFNLFSSNTRKKKKLLQFLQYFWMNRFSTQISLECSQDRQAWIFLKSAQIIPLGLSKVGYCQFYLWRKLVAIQVKMYCDGKDVFINGKMYLWRGRRGWFNYEQQDFFF